jgi:hypothetical protein
VLAAVDGTGDAYLCTTGATAMGGSLSLSSPGGGLWLWRAIGAAKASGCRSRTIEVPAAQQAAVGRAGLPLRWGAELDVGLNAVPRLVRAGCEFWVAACLRNAWPSSSVERPDLPTPWL